VVTHQLRIERRTAKERWPETDILLLSHADRPKTNASFPDCVSDSAEVENLVQESEISDFKISLLLLLVKCSGQPCQLINIPLIKMMFFVSIDAMYVA